MLGVIKKVQSFFASSERGEVALSHDEEIHSIVTHVINENFGVYIEPSMLGCSTFSLRLLPNESIELVPDEYRQTFVHTVNTFSSYVYVSFGIEQLLNDFYGKKLFTEETRLELKDIIESYVVMHESIVGKKMTTALIESIMTAINDKHMV